MDDHTAPIKIVRGNRTSGFNKETSYDSEREAELNIGNDSELERGQNLSNRIVTESTGEDRNIQKELVADTNTTDSENGDIKSKTVNSTKDNNFSWGTWNDWGVSSIFSTASQGVSVLTNSVSQSLNITTPEGKGNMTYEENKNNSPGNGNIENVDKNCDESKPMNDLRFNFGNITELVSGVSKLVEYTGTKVITGGLDTLETIGKKTMEVLQDGDPGLKKKQAFLKIGHTKPNLSNVLKEARDESEMKNKVYLENRIVENKQYETFFENYQGFVYFEALEMLSKQCEIKLQALLESCNNDSLNELQETLDQVKELCELPDEDEDEQVSLEEIKDRLKYIVDEVSLDMPYNNLVNIWEKAEHLLNTLNTGGCDETELHEKAIEILAHLAATAVRQFHKTGELVLLKTHHNTADEADCLVRLTGTLTLLIETLAEKFTECLNASISEDSSKKYVNDLITNVFYEAARSTSYIRDAFRLLVPVLQMGAVGTNGNS